MKVFLVPTHYCCENNTYLSTQLYNFFKVNGIGLVKNESDADTIVIVTCGFEKERENNAIKIVEDLVKKYGGNKKIIVTGCLPKINPSALSNSEITLINLQELSKFNKIFEPKIEIEQVKGNELNRDFLRAGFPEDYYIQICQGCVNNCSYCVIKTAKGHVKSKGINEIIKEFKTGIGLGFKRFVLLADDCGSYGLDINTDLANLLNSLDQSADKDFEINIHYIYPKRLIDLYPKISKSVLRKIYFMNIPLQSTSPRILKLMNRDYDINSVLEIIKEIKKINPTICLETHVIYGFPSETRNEFFMNFYLKDYFDRATFFIYSDGNGTKTGNIEDNISTNEIMYRTIRVIVEILKGLKMRHNKNLAIGGLLSNSVALGHHPTYIIKRMMSLGTQRISRANITPIA